MATINNTIYPPIIPTYQKAFIKDRENNVLFNIKFNVSEYTTITDIQTIEVQIMTLEGNHSILKGDHYFVNAEDVVNFTTRTGSIDILRTDTVVDDSGNIDINIGQFYIIQLRMNHGDAKTMKYQSGNGDNYKEEQNEYIQRDEILDSFSEWSTMSLIKCIDQPQLTLQDGKLLFSRTNRVTDMSDIRGYLNWKEKDSSEFLYSYRFRVYDIEDIPSKYNGETDKLFENIPPLEDSGEIRASTASPNRLHYVFRTNFIDKKRYRMFVSYETDNEYTETKFLNFYIQNFISSSNLAGAHANLMAYANNEIGGNELELILDDSYLSVPSKYLVFRRSSSKYDFKLWDDIHTVKLTRDNLVIDEELNTKYLQYNWVDFTAESGVFYKYCVQEVDLVDNRAEKIMSTNYDTKNGFYESIMRCEEHVAIRNLLSNINYFVKASLDNENWTINKDIGSMFFTYHEPLEIGNYTYSADIFITESVKIELIIKDIDKENYILKTKSFYLEGGQVNTLSLDFSLLENKHKIGVSLNILNIENDNITNLDFNFQKMEMQQILNNKHLISDGRKELIDSLILNLKKDYLINKDNTLQLGFDTSISSITKNRKDTITETINSKYPFVYRTGQIEYDSFNIEGTISILDTYTKFNTIILKDSLEKVVLKRGDKIRDRVKLHDVDNLFANKKDLLKYQDIYNIYEEYSNKYGLVLENDYNLEKMFREKVEQFLGDGMPKLFKNASLGNKLVMLTDISLSPKESLGGKIYTFSATMTEIDEANLINYDFYNIINLNNWREKVLNEEELVEEIENGIGQYSYIPREMKVDNVDVFSKIKEKYTTKNNNYIRSIYHLYKIKIDFSELTVPLIKDSTTLGKVKVNNKEFYISTNYPYLILDNVDITSLEIEVSKSNTKKVIVDYLTKISTLLVYSTEGWTSTSENYLGQLYNQYDENNSDIYKQIYDKYYYKDVEVMEKKITNVSKLLIQAYEDKNNLIPFENIGISIMDEKNVNDKDDKPYIHLTDEDGIIDLYDKERVMKKIFYKGVKVVPKIIKTNNVNLGVNEYNEIDSVIYPTEQELFKITGKPNTIYQVGQLNLNFYYNDDPLKYTTTITNNGLDIDIDSGKYSSSDVSNAIYQQLENGLMTLSVEDNNTNKYIYINNQFYKIDEDGFINLPVWLKITYLFDYLTKTKEGA